MRKITELATKAFYKWENFKLSNTEVMALDNVVEMYLHGNLIALKIWEVVTINDAWWKTTTTKERLNWVLKEFNIPFQIAQRNWIWYIVNSRTWLSEVWNGKCNFII